jgi:hypothetical protein
MPSACASDRRFSLSVEETKVARRVGFRRLKDPHGHGTETVALEGRELRAAVRDQIRQERELLKQARHARRLLRAGAHPEAIPYLDGLREFAHAARSSQRAADRSFVTRKPVSRKAPRARGAGRPAARPSVRASALSGDSGDDGPPGHLGPAGGRSRHSRLLEAVA